MRVLDLLRRVRLREALSRRRTRGTRGSRAASGGCCTSPSLRRYRAARQRDRRCARAAAAPARRLARCTRRRRRAPDAGGEHERPSRRRAELRRGGALRPRWPPSPRACPSANSQYRVCLGALRAVGAAVPARVERDDTAVPREERNLQFPVPRVESGHVGSSKMVGGPCRRPRRRRARRPARRSPPRPDSGRASAHVRSRRRSRQPPDELTDEQVQGDRVARVREMSRPSSTTSSPPESSASRAPDAQGRTASSLPWITSTGQRIRDRSSRTPPRPGAAAPVESRPTSRRLSRGPSRLRPRAASWSAAR